MDHITCAIEKVRERIRLAEHRFGRAEASVQLLAVSKTKPGSMIRSAAAAGQRDFGESYVQEALQKIEVLSKFDLCWHFIGPIQSNKTQAIAHHFDWVHSIDRLKIAQRLAEQRPAERAPLNICLQVNISGEASKSGVLPSETLALACEISRLQGLRLRGLMTIPARCNDFDQQRLPFRRLRELRDEINHQANLQLDTLSMGMSGDLEAAIAEGSTWVRVGTDIFGSRD